MCRSKFWRNRAVAAAPLTLYFLTFFWFSQNVLVAPAPLRIRTCRNHIGICDVFKTYGKAMKLHGSNVLDALLCVFVSWTTLRWIDVRRGMFLVSRGRFRNSSFGFPWSCGTSTQEFLNQPLDTKNVPRRTSIQRSVVHETKTQTRTSSTFEPRKIIAFPWVLNTSRISMRFRHIRILNGAVATSTFWKNTKNAKKLKLL